MTSITKEKGERTQSTSSTSTGADFACFRKRMAFQLAKALGRRQRLVSPGRLLEREPEQLLEPR
jgi:hypothetical protein